MSTISKTRQAAHRGERSKPHYYLRATSPRCFLVASRKGHTSTHLDFKDELALQAFEARIDWSTWGPSRTAI